VHLVVACPEIGNSTPVEWCTVNTMILVSVFIVRLVGLVKMGAIIMCAKCFGGACFGPNSTLFWAFKSNRNGENDTIHLSTQASWLILNEKVKLNIYVKTDLIVKNVSTFF